MSWGTKIAAVYIGFVLLIAGLIFRTSRENVDLVTENYYQQELDYQNNIDQRTAGVESGLQPVVAISGAQVKITFPEVATAETVSGSIQFYRPSDKSKDFSVDIKPDTNHIQLVDLSRFTTGVYQVKIAWRADQLYYSEVQLYVP